MATAKETLPKLMDIDGCIGCCIVDSNSGMMLGAAGGGSLSLEVAAAGNTEVVRSKRKTMKALNLSDQIEDMLITLGRQYHLLRPLASNDALFIYIVLDKAKANLAMARHQLTAIEREVVRQALEDYAGHNYGSLEKTLKDAEVAVQAARTRLDR